MPQNLQVFTIAAALAGACLLFFSIAGLLRLLRESEVMRVPPRPEQVLTFKEPGSYVLHEQHPRLSTALRSASYGLRSPGGQDVKLSPSIFRTTVSGFSSVRISVRTFTLEQPGAYRFLVTGIDPGADLSREVLVITRPFGTALFLRIIGIVGGGILLIGGVVLTALRYAGKL